MADDDENQPLLDPTSTHAVSPPPRHYGSSLQIPSIHIDRTPVKETTEVRPPESPIEPHMGAAPAQHDAGHHDPVAHHIVEHYGAAPIRFITPLSDDDERIFRKPRLRQFLHGNQLVREKIERKPSWHEAFYDLIFVTLIAHFSHDQLRTSLNPSFPVLFIACWRAWLDTTHFLNKFDADDKIFQLFALCEMIGVVGMGINADVLKYNSARGFAASYLIAKFFLFMMNLWVVIWVPKARPNCLYQMSMIALCSIPWWLSFLFTDIKTILILWSGGLLCEFLMILAIAYIANFFIPLNIEHITERLANFIVLVLGEDVASLFFVETGSYVFEPYLLGLLGMVIVFGFQMLYFDVEETSRHRLLHAMRRRKYTGQIWSILHILYTMALVVLAAGVALAIDGTLPNEHRKSKHSREEAEIRSRIYFTGGFAGALMASTLIGSLHKWHHTLETIPKWFRFMVRLTACFYMVSFSFILEDMAWMIGTGAALMVAVIVIELVGGQKKRGITEAETEDEEIALNQSREAIREGNFLA